MILQKLYIHNYKLLQEFSIEFEKQISVFIGINGSGKSSILEFLSLTFASAYEQLILKKKSAIAPEDIRNSHIEYFLRYENEYEKEAMSSKFKIDYIPVRLSIDDEGKFSTEINLPEKSDFFYKDLSQRFKDFALLPTRIITYYSGITRHQAEIHQTIEDYVLKQFRQNPLTSHSGYVENIHIPMYLFESSDFNLLFASLWSFGYVDRIKEMFSKLKIQPTENNFINIVISKVEFDKNDSKRKVKEIDEQLKSEPELYEGVENPRELLLSQYEVERVENFFGATGRLGSFLKQMSETSFNNHFVYDDIKEEYLFQFSIENWQYLSEDVIQNPKIIFELLLMLKHNGLLKSLSINLLKEKIALSCNQLSEGEKQVVIITGLNEVLGTSNTLFLFDEPDNYLHPSLQDDLIINIEENNNTNEMMQNHYIVTTHNPSFINNLNDKEGELFILNKGKIYEHHLKWFGRDVNDITREIMGSEIRPEWAESKIIEIDELLDKDYEKGVEAFIKLKTQLSSNDADIIRLQTKVDFLKD
ncbi:AAA family ATPase [Elizabethkingia anophelis]|nr:AAA family ATPase [Elizabethkingia anophelis]